MDFNFIDDKQIYLMAAGAMITAISFSVFSLPVFAYSTHRQKQREVVRDKINSCKEYANQVCGDLGINNPIAIF